MMANLKPLCKREKDRVGSSSFTFIQIYLYYIIILFFSAAPETLAQL